MKGNVSFIFEEGFVDHKVNKPMRSLYSTDLVHLDMKGMSLWLRKVRAFLGLVTLLKRPGRQSAEEHSHYDNPTAFRVFKNAEPRGVQKRRPTLSSIPVVTENRVGEHFLPGVQSRPTHSPGCREQETTTTQKSSQKQHAPNAIFSSCMAFYTLPSWSWSLAKPFLSLVSSTPARIV